MLTPRSLLRIARPPYFFQPLQILKRLRLEYLWRSKNEALVTLPWGLPIKINPHEAVGRNIAAEGLHEVDVTETLWRLTAPADLAVDAGANIGYTTSILGLRVGPKGIVHSFEPHPQVFQSLKENVALWKKDSRCGCFLLHEAALGKGLARLLFMSVIGSAPTVERRGLLKHRKPLPIWKALKFRFTIWTNFLMKTRKLVS